MTENKDRIILSEKERKEIYYFRKKIKEELLNPKEKTDNRKKVEEIMKTVAPSANEYFKKIEEAAFSAWFAYSELTRWADHFKEVHNNKVEDCPINGCLEDYSLEDGKEFSKRIFDEISNSFDK